MQNYLDLMVKIKNEGIDIFNERTQITCRTLVGAQLEYDLSSGYFPAITSKKLAFKSFAAELLGFFRGYTSAKDFRNLGCKFWDQNANETKAWLDNPFRKGKDDLGRIYSAQWTDWNDYIVTNDVALMETLGYELIGDSWNAPGRIMHRSINQLENALHTIITNPSDRRIIITGWNPGDMNKAALPACHMDYRFTPMNDELHVVMTIRSWDFFLGAPANISNTALFLSIMARLSGYKPGKVIIQATNVHIYENHYEAIEKQLNNELFELPKLVLSDKIKKVENLSEIKGIFTRIKPEDIWLEGYESHSAIKAPMAA